MNGCENELMRAIRQKCLDCSGGMRKEVERCQIKTCPLHEYRLGAAKAKAEAMPSGQISLQSYMREAYVQ